MSELFYQDAHLHLQDPRLLGSAKTILQEAQATGVNQCVVNGTSPEDWSTVTKLNEAFPHLIIPSYGLHPWKTPSSDRLWKDSLTQLINENPFACVGECGLDRWMQSPNTLAQEDAFRFQLGLAAEYNRPISIHVLKAWGWLLEILDSSPLPKRGFLLHSYGGSKETALRLCKLGGYFSFSGYFLHARKASVREAFQSIPRDRILIETDAPDMLPPVEFITHPLPKKANHPANLIAIAEGLAQILGAKKEAIAAQLAQNFQRFFLEGK